MLSQTAEYALRAAVHLAYQAQAVSTTNQIARATRVPRAYLAKLLRKLVHSGIVHSQRGQGGGLSLARPPAEVTLLQVISAVDPVSRIRECPLQRVEHGAWLCPLHRRLDEVAADVELAFGRTTLADVLVPQGAPGPACRFPAPEAPVAGSHPVPDPAGVSSQRRASHPPAPRPSIS
jgi:Rrf2 family protein